MLDIFLAGIIELLKQQPEWGKEAVPGVALEVEARLGRFAFHDPLLGEAYRDQQRRQKSLIVADSSKKPDTTSGSLALAGSDDLWENFVALQHGNAVPAFYFLTDIPENEYTAVRLAADNDASKDDTSRSRPAARHDAPTFAGRSLGGSASASTRMKDPPFVRDFITQSDKQYRFDSGGGGKRFVRAVELLSESPGGEDEYPSRDNPLNIDESDNRRGGKGSASAGRKADDAGKANGRERSPRRQGPAFSSSSTSAVKAGNAPKIRYEEKKRLQDFDFLNVSPKFGTGDAFRGFDLRISVSRETDLELEREAIESRIAGGGKRQAMPNSNRKKRRFSYRMRDFPGSLDLTEVRSFGANRGRGNKGKGKDGHKGNAHQDTREIELELSADVLTSALEKGTTASVRPLLDGLLARAAILAVLPVERYSAALAAVPRQILNNGALAGGYEEKIRAEGASNNSKENPFAESRGKS